MITAAAIIGQTNNPLLLRAFEPTDDLLKLHYVVHCSLDAVEEKLLLKRGPGDALDLYLGLLYPTQDMHKVYGYVTNTNIKFILLLDDEQAVKDEQLQKVFRRLHALYVDTVSNPFHTLGMPIRSQRFEAQLEAITGSYPKPLGSSYGGFQS